MFTNLGIMVVRPCFLCVSLGTFIGDTKKVEAQLQNMFKVESKGKSITS